MSFERYGLQDWWVSKAPRHRAQDFSYKYVIQPAANYKKQFAFHTFRVMLRHLKRAYAYWFYRCREMACRDLWLPTVPDNNMTVIHNAVKHCLYCLPSQVLLHKNKKPVQVNPCSQYAICPFCASRQAEEFYRRFMRARKTLIARETPAAVTYRCSTYFVPAKHFTTNGWSQKHAIDGTKQLHEILDRERIKYAQIAKELSTVTKGSFWRVVAYPHEFGWQVEVRQLYLTTPKSRHPFSRPRKSATTFLQSASVMKYKPAVKLLGMFVAYPPTLLTGYVELTAAMLNARRGLRLFNGTGQLYRRGRKRAEKKEVPTAPNVP